MKWIGSLLPFSWIAGLTRLGILGALASAFLPFGCVHGAEGSVADWRIAYEIEGYSADVMAVCLTDGARGNAPKWMAMTEQDAGPDCTELIYFDRPSKTIYLAFPSVLASVEYVCVSVARYSGRHPCTSSFFTPDNREPERRRLNRTMLKQALVDSGAYRQADKQLAGEREARRASCKQRLESSDSIDGLDKVLSACDGQFDVEALRHAAELRASLETRQHDAVLKEYRDEFEFATRTAGTEALDTFIARFARFDPDGLIQKAELLVKQRHLARYRAEYQALSISSPADQLTAFAEKYAHQDPERLTPRVRAMLDEQQRRSAAESAQQQRRATAEYAQQQQRQALAELESRISNCKRAISAAQASKAREQQVASESGYTRPMVLRQAAEIEIDCKSMIDQAFRQYRGLGGHRNLADIN